MKDEQADYIRALDSEIEEAKGIVAYNRAFVMVLAFALSGIFWDIAGRAADNQFGTDIVWKMAPFVIAAIFLAVAALEFLIVYEVNAGIQPADAYERPFVLLPHMLAMLVFLLMGVLASLASVYEFWRLYGSLTSLDWAVWVLYGFSLVQFTGATIGFCYVLRPRQLAAYKRMMSAKIIMGMAVGYLILAFIYLYYAWSHVRNITVMTMAFKATLGLFALAYGLAKVNDTVKAVSVLNRLKAERRKVYARIFNGEKSLSEGYRQMTAAILEAEGVVLQDEVKKEEKKGG